ncbi:hypothetical protein AGMMS50293_04060 [Spirochaetia bacterium]|nr:hypothetical protein AGMMS50293_04060 [Spirochaetia bacterium]
MTRDPKEATPEEAEFREIFTTLDENAQDRLMDTARALNFAAAIRTPGAITREGEAGEKEQGV